MSHPFDGRFRPDGHLYVVGRDNNRVMRLNGINGALPCPIEEKLDLLDPLRVQRRFQKTPARQFE